jgi:hypothetical protein
MVLMSFQMEEFAVLEDFKFLLCMCRVMYVSQTWDGAGDLPFLPLEKGHTIC